MGKYMNFTGTMLKNLFSKPVTVDYPAKPYNYPERSRGHVEISIDDCISCGICKLNCPSGALKVDKAAGTWTINRFDCIQCGYCVEKCPKKCLKIVPGYQEPMDKKSEETFTKTVVPEATATSGDSSKPQYPKADASVCVYCTLCAKKCPASALNVDRAQKTWELDKDACMSCGMCASSCPKKCITME